VNIFRDIAAIFSASRSFCAAAYYLVNMSLHAAGSKRRFRKIPLTQFRMKGVTYFANSWDGLLVLRPSHEPEVHATIDRISKDSSGQGLFVNVGAHIGRYTLEFAASFAKTIAYEPTPATFTLLKQGADRHPHRERIDLRPLCVGDYQGTTFLHLQDSESQNSITSCARAESMKVLMTSLDSDLSMEERLNLKLLLIDAEGAESMVLNGARDTLASSDCAVILEALGDEEYYSCNLLLADIGFRPERIDRTNWLFTKSGARGPGSVCIGGRGTPRSIGRH
jgi:FkbM family methyltransferase